MSKNPLKWACRKPSRLAATAFASILAAALMALNSQQALADQYSELHAEARSGNSEAQYRLAVMYDLGDEVDKDHYKSFDWYRRAADQGHAKAQYNLGVAYDNGEGCPVNHEAAYDWYLKAASQGHSAAMYNLGVSYYNGEGVEEDEEEAMRWLRLSAANNNEAAIDLLKRLED